ncbi:MAG: hypothetical protein JWQ35_1612 [Bacteriovoracaceae bacterium]|nr:hypothetical protein [Bacteriovoracaceae bacterium]
MNTQPFFENQSNEWLPTNKAASYLGITANALRILVCRQRVQAFKLGSRLRFRICDLKCLLQKKEGGA